MGGPAAGCVEGLANVRKEEGKGNGGEAGGPRRRYGGGRH